MAETQKETLKLDESISKLLVPFVRILEFAHRTSTGGHKSYNKSRLWDQMSIKIQRQIYVNLSFLWFIDIYSYSFICFTIVSPFFPRRFHLFWSAGCAKVRFQFGRFAFPHLGCQWPLGCSGSHGWLLQRTGKGHRSLHTFQDFATSRDLKQTCLNIPGI